ncbi:hypothetical protein REPUB_Repub19eG0077500 [Reevesia pubescens]
MYNAKFLAATVVRCDAKCSYGDASRPEALHVVPWQAPYGDMIKVKVDVSFDIQTHKARLGVVARNCSGEVMFFAVEVKENVTSALVAELLAIWIGMILAKEWNIRSIIIESECMVAANEVNKFENSLVERGCLVEDIKDLSSFFNYCNIFHTRKSANNLAHVLTKINATSSNIVCWTRSLPPEWATTFNLNKFDIL